MESNPGLVRFAACNEVKMMYSDRIDSSHWDPHKATVAMLHAVGCTKPHILDVLKATGFQPSYKQLRTKMYDWDLTLNNWGASSNNGRLAAYRSPDEIEASESSPEIAIDEAYSSPLSLEPRPGPEDAAVTDPGPFLWTHHTDPLPTYDQLALSVPANAELNRDESVVSRQTFATHPSETSSNRRFRQFAWKIHESRKIEKGRLESNSDGIPFRPKRISECHLCGDFQHVQVI